MIDHNRKRSQRSLEIFIKVTRRLAVKSGLNKHSHNQALRTAHVVLLVGSVTAASLLPSIAVPESRVAAAAPGAALSATARLTFKIIVPQVLYLQVGSLSERVLGADTVAVMSNGHDVSLNASLRPLDSHAPARFDLILNGAARKGVAQDAHCSPAPRAAAPVAVPAGDAGTRQVLCTVSMP
jgi:hypothetical protein